MRAPPGQSPPQCKAPQLTKNQNQNELAEREEEVPEKAKGVRATARSARDSSNFPLVFILERYSDCLIQERN